MFREAHGGPYRSITCNLSHVNLPTNVACFLAFWLNICWHVRLGRCGFDWYSTRRPTAPCVGKFSPKLWCGYLGPFCGNRPRCPHHSFGGVFILETMTSNGCPCSSIQARLLSLSAAPAFMAFLDSQTAQVNASLQTVNLNKNPIGDEGAKALAEALKASEGGVGAFHSRDLC